MKCASPVPLTIKIDHCFFLCMLDYNLQQVLRVDKTNGQNQVIYRENMAGVKIVKVMARPPGQVNSCSDNNGGCAHLCLPVGVAARVCKCSMGYQLNPDGKTCRSKSVTVEEMYLKASKL